MADAKSILAPLDIPNSVKADAWDAYNDAASPEDMTARLKKLPLSNNVRADLWDAYSAKAPAEQPSVGGFLKNLVSSGAEQVKNIATAVRHPINAIAGAADIAAGGINAIGATPEERAQQDQDPAVARSNASFDAFAQALKKKYGSVDAIKHTLYTDPAGALMDVSVALDGAAGLAGKTGEVADAARLTSVANTARKVEDVAKTAATNTNPLVLATKPVAAVARPIVARVARGFANPNAAETDAVRFAEQRGIPVDAGVATGNKFVQGVEALSDRTPIGAVVAQGAKADEAAAMTRVGGEIADQVHPNAVAPTQAGRDVTSAIEEKIAGHGAEADRQYSTLREIENDPANVRNVQTGTKQVPAKDPKTGQTIPDKFTTEPVMEDVALPVDLRPTKEALRPVYNQIMRQLPITQQRASAGIKAIENILHGPDAAPATQVDMDLGTIKAAARGADLPELKTLSQGLAARAVQDLHNAVTDAVGRAERTPPGGLRNAAPISAPEEQPLAADTGGSQPSAEIQESTGSPQAANSNEAHITVPGESTVYNGRYEVRDLSEIQPSHHGQTFNPNPRYGLKNDRNYSNPINQRKVVEWSTPEKFDPAYHVTDNPDASNGPPIVDADGNVLGGNGRTMIMQRVYAGNEKGAAAYRQMLAERAPQFGIDPAEVAKVKNPVLVRVLDDTEINKQNAISDFNKTGTAALTPAEQAISDSRRVSPETLDHIGSEIDRLGHEATLAQVIEGQGGRDIMRRLIQDGVISPQEGAKLMTETELTRAGKERLGQLMLGRFFKDPEQLESMAAAPRNKLERIAAPLARLESEGDFSLTPHVQGAIDLLDAARGHKLSVEDYLTQTGLFTKERYSPEAIEIAKQLRDVNPNDLTYRVRSYLDQARYASEYEGPGMFGDFPEPKTPREAFNTAFKTELADQPAEAPAETSTAPAKSADFDESFKPTPEPSKKTAPALGSKVGSQASQEALDALNAGRKATREKYETDAVRKSLTKQGEEGRLVFDQAIWRNDAGIEHLRKVQQMAPAEIPKIARAFLDEMLEKATSEGGFKGGATLQAKWQALGPETKTVLFPNPMMRRDLDRFFLLAKRAGESANPSATSLVSMSGGSIALAFTHPLTGVPMIIGAGALSKLLHNPSVVHAITNGFVVPAANKGASAMAAARILKLAGQAAQQDPRYPMAAEASPAPPSDQPPLVASR